MAIFIQFFKPLLLVALLVVGHIVLWEVPSWERNSHSHEEIPTALDVSISLVDSRSFLRHIKTRLPQYREQFIQAGERYGVPWVLLAAQSYQESRWNRNAMSPTGVRGLMMLTRATASDLGIKNRLDPRKSIRGGARYFAKLQRQLPQDVQGIDRTYFALAAYNVGMGHVKDAQVLASRLKKDPTRWDDLKMVLPLLAKKEYYRTLPSRYARGWEPVQYVKRIRAYREILEHMIREGTLQQAEL